MAKYIVTTSALRIRSGPGTTYSIVGMLYKNNTIEGNELNGDWVHITTAENQTGWSHRAYLELVAETTPPPTAAATYRVDASTLNLRQGPGLTYAVIGSLKQGEMLEGLAVSGDNQWAQVRKSTGVTGWCSLKYLTKVTPPPPPAPTDVQMTVSVDTLNFRSGPSEGFPIIGQLKRGEVVVYLNATP